MNTLRELPVGEVIFCKPSGDVAQEDRPSLWSAPAGFLGRPKPSPLKMKVMQPSILSYVGFRTTALGMYYLQKRGLDAVDYGFADMEHFFSSSTMQEREGTAKVLYFPDEQTVDLFAKDPASFPSDEHDLFPGEILKQGLIRNPLGGK